MASKHRVAINLATEEYEALCALSEENRISLAWLGRQAIIEYLARYGGRQPQLSLNLPTTRGAAKE